MFNFSTIKCCCFFIYLLFAVHLNVYAQDEIPRPENQETERIAVLPIVNLLGKQAILSRDEIHVFSTIIQKNVQKHTQPYFQVMTNENIRQLLAPGKTLEDCVGDCEVEYGRSLGAHYMITGSLVKFGKQANRMRLILKMHDTKKGTLLGIIMIQGVDSEEIENQLESQVLQLVEVLKEKAPKIISESQAENFDQKADLDKLRKASDLVKKLIDRGDEKGKEALILLMAEFGKKPWAASFIIEIQRFYDEKQLALQALKAMQSLKSKNPNKAGIVWISITGGSFMMGSQDEYSNEIPVHPVQIKSFDISKTEVTVGQYQQCVDAGVCSLPGDQNDHVSCNWGQFHRDLHPINCVDWLQARTFAKWVGGDLPTEAQWEYVARSQGKDFRYPWGNTEPTCEYAVMNDNGDGCGKNQTWAVCSKVQGNTLQSVCDMGGNVWEWVLDEWHDSYHGAPHHALAWCSGECDGNHLTKHVYRGGTWNLNGAYLRSTYRTNHASSFRYSALGFRVSRSFRGQ